MAATWLLTRRCRTVIKRLMTTNVYYAHHYISCTLPLPRPTDYQYARCLLTLSFSRSTVFRFVVVAVVVFTLSPPDSGVGLRFGVVVASLVSINEVNLRRARLVLGWATVSGFDSRRRHFISVYVTGHPGRLSLLPSVGR